MEDHRLIKRIQKGDKKAFEELVEKHYAGIYSYCLRKTQKTDVAADITQDVFLKLLSSIYRYQFSGKFTNYILTIAYNTCMDYLRTNKRERIVEDLTENIPTLPEENPQNIWLKKEEENELYQNLKKLPDIQQEALLLYYYHGLKAKDIAVVTNVPLATAKSRIKQGIDKLKKSMKKNTKCEEREL